MIILSLSKRSAIGSQLAVKTKKNNKGSNPNKK
jgi:hypothetical protein